jgi:hypothetical protein
MCPDTIRNQKCTSSETTMVMNAEKRISNVCIFCLPLWTFFCQMNEGFIHHNDLGKTIATGTLKIQHFYTGYLKKIYLTLC